MELPTPLPVERAIRKLARDLALARRRRSITQRSLAERMGASLPTVQRMEKGDPRISLLFIARALHVFGELERLNQLLDTGEDSMGLVLMDNELPKRIRPSKRTRESGAL